MQIGDLIRFRYVYSNCDLNYKRAIYLGEDFLRRYDGAVIENHKILEIGASKPTIIDKGLLKYIEVCDDEI